MLPKQLKKEFELIKNLWVKGWTPVKVDVLEKYLHKYMYINGNDAKWLLNGFQHGISLQYTGPRVAVIAKNIASADIHKDETLAKLQSEVMLGRMTGPFSTKPISILRISPIGLVSKSDGGGVS